MSRDKYDDYDTDDIMQVQKVSRRKRQSTPPVKTAKKASSNGGMSPKSGKKKPKKKMTLKKKVIMILGCIVCAYALLILGLIASTYLNSDDNDDWFTNTEKTTVDRIKETFTAKIPDRTTFAILGTDEDGTRTDTIMVGCYNSVNNGISLISVPRDTVISASAANYEIMRSSFPEPGRRTMKINAVHHFGGEEHGVELAVDELENLLDIDIDYYVKVNFDAFTYLIDSIGGIEFDVPMDMYYQDPTQDLDINLKAGMQKLNGDQAEQLVRFRSGYTNADLGRISVQQDFMKAFLAQAVSSNAIFKNPSAYIKTFFKYVETNMSIADAAKYATNIKTLDTSNIQTYVLPGKAAYVNGISGYKVDDDETSSLIYTIFKQPISEQNTATAGGEKVVADSHGLSIQVLNGGYTNGMAAKISTMLSDKGYKVDSIGTYNNEKDEQTRIYVTKDGAGEDLVDLFDDAKVIVDSSQTEGYDITIVVGSAQE